MGYFNTLIVRLLIIFAILLIATLSIQFYLNLNSQNENNARREVQQQTLSAGFALGMSGITSKQEYLEAMIAKPGHSFLDEEALARILDVIIINEKWQINDSLKNPEFAPNRAEDGSVAYTDLAALTDLPPLMQGGRLGDDLARFPNRRSEGNKTRDDEAHAIPIETSEGRYYVMVVLKNDKDEISKGTAATEIYTLGIFLVSTAITFLLVWRFTRPITDLANAARRIADGDLGFRVPNVRNDEMGRLTQRFNEMTAELEKSKLLEEQLQQAEKSAVIGRLGSAIAHEIRNPLNYINLTLDHLRSKLAPEDAEKQAMFKKLVGQIKDEVARINSRSRIS